MSKNNNGTSRILSVAKIGLVAALALAMVASFSGCGASTASSDDKTITVAASPTPHADILAVAGDVLAQEGYTLKVVEYTDYIQPNVATTDGAVDANYFQHQPYLTDYNTENGTDLVSAGAIHFEPLGIYAGKTSSLSDLKEGATVAVPNDTTNEARALLLLQDQGLITLSSDAGFTATTKDITSNKLNLKFVEVEAAAVASTLSDTDIAVINGNYAISAGLSVSDALATEGADSEAAQTYANIVAVTPANLDSDKTKALVSALQSQEVKDYINEQYQGSVVAVF